MTSSIAGRLVDRYDPRKILMVANVIGAIGSILQWASPTPLMLGLATLVAGSTRCGRDRYRFRQNRRRSAETRPCQNDLVPNYLDDYARFDAGVSSAHQQAW